MVGFFRERNSFHIVALVFITILAKMAYLLHPPLITYQASTGLLPAWLNEWYAGGGSKGLSAFLALMINFCCALYANNVLMGQRMYPKTSFVVALSMVLLSSLVPAANVLSAPLILLPLLIFIYQKGASLYNTPVPRSVIYNIGLAAGIGTILYHPFAIFTIAVMGTIASMRTFRIQEWLILLLGLLSPYYLFLSWQFIRGHWHPQQYLPILGFSIKHIPKDVYSLVTAGVVLLWTIIGMYCWQANLQRMLIQPRKNWGILLLLTILSTVLFFVQVSNGMDSFALAVFPFSCFAASAFVFPKKLLWPTFLFWVIVFVVIIVSVHHTDIIGR